MVPFGGIPVIDEVSVAMRPKAVPASRKRQFGYVCARTEQK